jgi:hypothetical protein
VLVSIGLVVKAKPSLDSTLHTPLIEAFADSLHYPGGTLMPRDTMEIRNKIRTAYKYIEVYNETNEREGRAEENIYVIDPHSFELDEETETFVYIPSNKVNHPAVQIANKRLMEFNNSRKGIDSNTGKEKDGLVIYAVLFPECYQAFLKKSALSFPEGNTYTLKDFFDEKQANGILTFRDYTSKVTNHVESIASKHHPKRIIYTYASVTYFKPITKEGQSYLLQSLDVELNDEKLNSDPKEKLKLEELEKQIEAKADLNALGKCKDCKDDTGYISMAIEKIILAVEKIIDGKGGKSDNTIASSNCKKPGTWPMSSARYTAMLNRFQAATSPLGLSDDFHVLVDNIENFNNPLGSV